MAIQAIQSTAWLPSSPAEINGAPSIGSLIIDAADEGAGFCFQAPATGNIAKIGWGTRAVTSSSTLDIRLETVDAATGFPSGTLKGTNTNGSQSGLTANTAYLTTLTAAAAVTQGDYLAVVIKQPNASPGNCAIAVYADDIGQNFPFALLNTGTSPAVSWAKQGAVGTPIMWIEYDDGSYYEIPFCWPIKDTITSNAISTSTTPDVIGIRFRLPFPARLSRAWIVGDFDGDFKAMLVSDAYHQANATGILATLTVDKDFDASSNQTVAKLTLTAAYDLVANTWYRLIVEPTSATSLTIYDFNLNSLAAMDAWGGQDMHLTTAKDPTGDGSWTNYNSGTFRKLFAGLGLTGFDDGASVGGLLVHPGMAGGMRG